MSEEVVMVEKVEGGTKIHYISGKVKFIPNKEKRFREKAELIAYDNNREKY